MVCNINSECFGLENCALGRIFVAQQRYNHVRSIAGNMRAAFCLRQALDHVTTVIASSNEASVIWAKSLGIMTVFPPLSHFFFSSSWIVPGSCTSVPATQQTSFSPRMKHGCVWPVSFLSLERALIVPAYNTHCVAWSDASVCACCNLPCIVRWWCLDCIVSERQNESKFADGFVVQLAQVFFKTLRCNFMSFRILFLKLF